MGILFFTCIKKILPRKELMKSLMMDDFSNNLFEEGVELNFVSELMLRTK